MLRQAAVTKFCFEVSRLAGSPSCNQAAAGSKDCYKYKVPPDLLSCFLTKTVVRVGGKSQLVEVLLHKFSGSWFTNHLLVKLLTLYQNVNEGGWDSKKHTNKINRLEKKDHTCRRTKEGFVQKT